MGLACAKAGARALAFTYSKHDHDAQNACSLLQRTGITALAYKGSVSDQHHVQDTVRGLQQQWGGIDVLINNAAINQMYPLPLLEAEDWDEVVNVNLKGAYLFSRAVLKHMICAKKGHILNLGSFATERMIESPLHYASSKAGLRGFTEALALEVGRHNIMVNLLAPGLLDAGMSTMVPQHRVQQYLEHCALGRLANADEIAATATFLVSDMNTFMTGAKIVMDGGL
jgi:NAD(P)-dependent dehydrogenase (short-subunit alcohol dehydrogenase family)